MHRKKNIAFSSVGDEQCSIWFLPVPSYSSTLDWVVVALCDSLLQIMKSLISKLGLPLVSCSIIQLFKHYYYFFFSALCRL